MAANVNFEAKTTWVQNEIVYPADANRWEKGIKDCADLVNDHNARIPVVETELPKKVNKAGDTMTGRLSMGANDILFQNPDGGSLLQIATDGSNWDVRGDATWLRFNPSQFGLTLRDMLGAQDFFKVLDSKTVKDYIVERWSDGDRAWYTKYASGWIEQGGKASINANTVLPVPMRDDKYTITIAPIAGGNHNYRNTAVSAITSTSFTNNGSWYDSVYYKVEGYFLQ